VLYHKEHLQLTEDYRGDRNSGGVTPVTTNTNAKSLTHNVPSCQVNSSVCVVICAHACVVCISCIS